MTTLDWLFTLFDSFGYLGVFTASFVGSIIVFVPVPYFPVLVAAALSEQLDPNLISLVSAVGVLLAKMIIFYASYYGRSVLSNKTKQRMFPLQKVLRRYGGFGAFIVALTPIPDDVVYIPLGLARYSPWKFAIATFTGKFILNEIIVWSSVILGRPFFESFISADVDPLYLTLGIIGSVAVLVVIVYLSVRVNWARVIGKWFPWAVDSSDNDDIPNQSKST
ncbi:MAG: VTT domain-containing protein [Nitrososphaeraceae archaeon]